MDIVDGQARRALTSQSLGRATGGQLDLVGVWPQARAGKYPLQPCCEQMYASLRRSTRGRTPEGPMATVNDSEVDRTRHDAYLHFISSDSDPLSRAMHAMGTAAGTAAQSLSVGDCATASAAMSRVRDC